MIEDILFIAIGGLVAIYFAINFFIVRKRQREKADTEPSFEIITEGLPENYYIEITKVGEEKFGGELFKNNLCLHKEFFQNESLLYWQLEEIVDRLNGQEPVKAHIMTNKDYNNVNRVLVYADAKGVIDDYNNPDEKAIVFHSYVSDSIQIINKSIIDEIVFQNFIEAREQMRTD